MKPGKDIKNSDLKPGDRRFWSGVRFFLAAIGIIVGVISLAQREISAGNTNQTLDNAFEVYSYTYWHIFRDTGPLGLLSFLLMFGLIGWASFQKTGVRTWLHELASGLPLFLGGSMTFLKLPFIHSDYATMYIMECRLFLMVGASSSLLCFLITRLRQQIS